VRARLAAGDRPYVSLKAAISLDGRIATRAGQSQWITGEAARAYAHRLRAKHDAVLVGIGTVLADDPRLTVRLPDCRAAPARVVLDSRCRVPDGAKCLTEDGAQRIVVAGSEAPASRVEALRAAGVEVLICEGTRPAPAAFLPLLRERGIGTVLVEGGAQVHANLIANRAADELFLIVAGMVIGGGGAPGWCAALGVESLEEAPRLRLDPPARVGAEVVLHGHFDGD
jgi:diaminohydroxyphosphoribosylaminopyrimidine deaminase/5-amino-6-(5-phosphoribosylamino)uracil reductase